MSHNDSRKEGTAAAVGYDRHEQTAARRPSYVLVGFSQGAVIAGDLASDIGNSRGPVDGKLVLGVTLIADGRRRDRGGAGRRTSPPGRVREITLKVRSRRSALGLTMSGERPAASAP